MAEINMPLALCEALLEAVYKGKMEPQMMVGSKDHLVSSENEERVPLNAS